MRNPGSSVAGGWKLTTHRERFAERFHVKVVGITHQVGGNSYFDGGKDHGNLDCHLRLRQALVQLSLISRCGCHGLDDHESGSPGPDTEADLCCVVVVSGEENSLRVGDECQSAYNHGLAAIRWIVRCGRSRMYAASVWV